MSLVTPVDSALNEVDIEPRELLIVVFKVSFNLTISTFRLEISSLSLLSPDVLDFRLRYKIAKVAPSNKNKIINKILLLFSVFLFFSCNEIQKLLRNEDVKIKYEMAEKYYENEEWRRASNLFEQISPKYRGRPQAERITFFLCK